MSFRSDCKHFNASVEKSGGEMVVYRENTSSGWMIGPLRWRLFLLRTLHRSVFYCPTFETSAGTMFNSTARLWGAEVNRPVGRYWSLTNNGRWWVKVKLLTFSCGTVSFSSLTLCPFTPGQVSVAKILFGVFALAVVVVLIVVPTVVLLKGESNSWFHSTRAAERSVMTQEVPAPLQRSFVC